MQRFPFVPLILMACLVVFGYFSISPRTYPEALIERFDAPDGPVIVFNHNGMTMMTFYEDNWNFVESASDPHDSTALPIDYMQYLANAPLMYTGRTERLLMIGMGGGMVTSHLHHYLPQMDITAVEISPTVVEVARKHFGFVETPHYRPVVMDGLEYLMQQTQPYDIILLDAFADNTIPAHLATPEFYQEVAARLRDGGVAAQNIETVNTPPKEVIAAMSAAFDHLDIYAVRSNFVLIGYNGVKKNTTTLRTQAQTYPGLRYPPEAMISRRKEVK